MNIHIRVPSSGLRYWVIALARALEHACRAKVQMIVVDERSALPASVHILLYLERMLSRPSLPWAGMATRADLQPFQTSITGTADVTIDLTANACSSTLRPLYDGQPGEAGMFAALLGNRMPHITIENTSGNILLAAGCPSGEAASGLNETCEATAAAVITLFISALKTPTITPKTMPCFRRRTPHVLEYAARHLAYSSLRRLYKLCFNSPHWHVGWRWHDGCGVMDTLSLNGVPWNVLPDDGKRFFADPFPVQWEGRTFVFMEELAHSMTKGIISAVEFTPHGPVGSPQPVLEESTHLSYPFLIEDKGTLWMIPESSNAHEIALYRCVRFPDKWEKAAVLVSGIAASDSTVIWHGDRFWLFCTSPHGDTNSPQDIIPLSVSHSDRLMLFHAPHLIGPWQPHALNPVMLDSSQARPAGTMVVRDGKLLRPAQNCVKGYGTALSLCRVDRLDTHGFSQTVQATLYPGAVWPGRKLHTINRAGPLEVIDGTAHNLKTFTVS
jgi:hypothetical protein